MFNPIQMLILYFTIWFVIDLIFGYATSKIGSSFWWGFLFGPFGLLIAAVLVSGKRNNQVIVVNAGMPSKGVRIRRPGDAPAAAPPKVETELEEFNRRFAELNSHR